MDRQNRSDFILLIIPTDSSSSSIYNSFSIAYLDIIGKVDDDVGLQDSLHALLIPR